MTTTTPRPTDELSRELWREHERPALAPVDRLALHVGLQLLLWSRRRSVRADRAEQARAGRAADHAAASVQRTFAARTHAGPTW